MLQCCVSFRGERFALTDKNGLYDRYLEYGVCPVCGRDIAIHSGKRFIDNQTIIDKKVKRKAINLYNECIKDVTHNIHKVKFGTKFNAGFHYGENKQSTDGKTIRIYRVDFNNTKDLLETKISNG